VHLCACRCGPAKAKPAARRRCRIRTDAPARPPVFASDRPIKDKPLQLRMQRNVAVVVKLAERPALHRRP